MYALFALRALFSLRPCGSHGYDKIKGGSCIVGNGRYCCCVAGGNRTYGYDRCRAGWPGRPLGSGWSRRSLFALRPLAAGVALGTLRPSFALRTLFALGPLFADKSPFPLISSVALSPGRAKRALISLWTDWTTVTGRTYRPLIAGNSLGACAAGLPLGTGFSSYPLRTSGALGTCHPPGACRSGTARISFHALGAG